MVMLVLRSATPLWVVVMVVPFRRRSGGGGDRPEGPENGLLSAGDPVAGRGFYYYLTGSGLIATRMAAMLGIGITIFAHRRHGHRRGFAAGLAGYAVDAVGAAGSERPAKKERSMSPNAWSRIFRGAVTVCDTGGTDPRK